MCIVARRQKLVCIAHCIDNKSFLCSLPYTESRYTYTQNTQNTEAAGSCREMVKYIPAR